jgi:hypothetical protein
MISVLGRNHARANLQAMTGVRLMKTLLALLLILHLPVSCASNGPGGEQWPTRTRDSQLMIRGDKSLLSAADIADIHEAVWSKNPNLRILGIQVINRQTVLLSCTDQPGERFTRFLGFDLIRSGEGWREGNYKSGSRMDRVRIR